MTALNFNTCKCILEHVSFGLLALYIRQATPKVNILVLLFLHSPGVEMNYILLDFLSMFSGT